MRAEERHPRGRRSHAIGAGIAIAVLAAALLSGCGGSGSSDAETSAPAAETSAPASESPAPAKNAAARNAATGAADKSAPKAAVKTGPVYHLTVEGSEFSTLQKVGETSVLHLGWHNFGDNTVPMLAISLSTTPGHISVTGRDGLSRSPAFVSPAGGPVWKLLPGYPRLVGSSRPAGTTPDGKTFTFGPLAPGATKKMIWKLRAVAPGEYTLKYRASGDLSNDSRTKSPYPGLPPGSWYEIDVAPGKAG